MTTSSACFVNDSAVLIPENISSEDMLQRIGINPLTTKENMERFMVYTAQEERERISKKWGVRTSFCQNVCGILVLSLMVFFFSLLGLIALPSVNLEPLHWYCALLCAVSFSYMSFTIRTLVCFRCVRHNSLLVVSTAGELSDD